MNNSCIKRINREIDYLQTNKPEYQIYSFTQNTDKTLTLEIVSPNLNILEFIIGDDYPFKPPISLKLNGKNYRYLIKHMPARIEHLYYNPDKMYPAEICYSFTKPECLCCTGLLCPVNWSPVVTIGHILKEINGHNYLKRHFSYKLLLKELFDHRRLPLELIRSIYQYL